MYRTTQDVLEVRRWAEAHGALPCRDGASGRPVLSLPGAPCGEEVGWEEFEPTFVTCGYVFVHEDAPGSDRCFVGLVEEAQAFVASGGPGEGADGPAASP